MAKVGTYGSMETAEQPQVVPETTTETAPEQAADEIKIDIPEDAGAATEEPATEEASAAEETTTNETSFDISDWDEPSGEQQSGDQKPAERSWQETLASVDAEEVLKHLGLDEFTINLHKHLSNGGKAQDYIDARGRDWAAVSDMDIMRLEYADRYPNLSDVEIDRLLVKKYGEDEMDEDGQIELKADAYKARQSRVENDKKFKIAERQQPVQEEKNNSEEIEAQIQQQLHYFANHEATKALNQSKRVAVDLGDGQSFNFNIDKPESLTRVITDANIWQKVVSNEKGEPDVAKLHQIALFAINPKKFVKDLVNYGKSLGHLREIEEGRNAVPGRARPANASEEKPTYRVGTYGNRG